MKAKTEVQKIEKIVEVEEKVYTLTLNHEEVCALQAVLGKIGGTLSNSPENLRDVVTDELYGRLDVLGVKFSDESVQKYAKHIVTNMNIK